MSNLSLLDDIINKLENSKAFIELDKYYKSVRTLDLFNYYGQENPHTAFLSNLFKPSNPYTNDDTPFKLFLKLLSIAHELPGNEKLSEERIAEYKELGKNCKKISQLVINPQTKFGGSKYQPDITIRFNVGKQKYIVLVECKISAEENDEKKYNGEKYKQTELYRAICEHNKYEDKYKVYYVFLSPFREKGISDCKNWVKISFQDLVDYVLYRCSIEPSNINISFTIEEYINSYSNSYFKENIGALRLAVTPKEKKLVKTIWNDNQETIRCVLDILINESGNKTDEEVKEVNEFYANKYMILLSTYYILNYLNKEYVSDEEMKKLKQKELKYCLDNKSYSTKTNFIYYVLKDILNNTNLKINSFDDIPASIVGEQYNCPRLALKYEDIIDKNKQYFDASRRDRYPLLIPGSNESLWYANIYSNSELKNFINDVKNEYGEYKNRIKVSLL